ncbi:MAG: amidohydrolase family protein [Saprospiraceae bacterium]|nr:amidohydrolase family protein [Saprospiraceae bacterium]
MFRIIDCHCHAGKGDGLTGPWDTDAPLERYLQWAQAAGIGQTVLFAAFHSDYARANAEVARLVATQPQRFFGFAFVHAQHDRGRIFHLVQTAVEQYGFCGIKVHRHDGRITREVCDVARAFAVPVLYDVMGEVSAVELLATEYPTVNFIIPHLGSFADDWRAQLALIPMLERHANVFTDTSGVRRFDLLEQAVRRAGATKVLFGADGPWLHPGVELEKVFALQLPDAATREILAGNFLRLIRNRRRRALPPAGQTGAGIRAVPDTGRQDPWSQKPGDAHLIF